MNKIYFNNNFFKLKRASSEIGSFMKDYGIEDENYLKIIRKVSVELLKNRKKILDFLQEKTSDSFKDLSNSDLILITLISNHFKQAKREASEIQKSEDDKKEIAKILAAEEILTLRKLLKDNKTTEIKDITKTLSKIRAEVAIIVKPKRDSERIIKIKLLVEILNSIIQDEKKHFSSEVPDIIKEYDIEYEEYSRITNVDMILDFKNFDASNWDIITAANIQDIRRAIIAVKQTNKDIKESKLHDKTVIVAINTLNNLHDLLSELKKIKDLNTHRKYYKDKFLKTVIPILTAYSTNLDWKDVIHILEKTGWNDLLSLIPKKIRKQYK